MSNKQVKTYCRFCHAYCPMIATVEDNKLLAIGPDTDNEIYGGYTCFKGRQLVEQIYHPERLLSSQKKNAAGKFEDIDSASAFDEIADKLQEILQKHGPRSIASYNGTYSYQNSASHSVARAFHNAIQSPSYYASVSIDQPAKVAIGPARMGWWNGGSHMWNDSDVALIVGNNTLVSHFSIPGGIPFSSPSNALREGKKRGMKIICIDPRRTEVASRADLHIQPKPGQDAILLAALVNVILSESLHDKEFCAEHVEGLDTLREQVAQFTPEYVAARADVPAEHIIDAARTFANAKKGTAVSGTGPEMSPHPNLMQHMIQCLNAICGRFYREGERMPNPGVLTAPMARLAQASPPQPQWLNGLRSRVSDEYGELFVLSPYGPQAEMPAALLSDEILMAGDGQIKALICVGGNPLLAFPDQEKTYKALQHLELLVCIDVKMAATAQIADYVIAPKICLEREDVTLLTDIWHDKPYSQYTDAVIATDADVVEEWEVFWELGKRMGLDMTMDNGAIIDTQNKPGKYDILSQIVKGSRVPLEDIRARQGGHVYDIPDVIVEAADPQTKARLQLAPEGLSDECNAAAQDADQSLAQCETPTPSFLLISRRMKNTYNSTGPELSFLGGKGTTNPAYIHPQDLKDLNIEDDELIEISSGHGSIPAVARASDDIKPGVISMSHCWGGSPDPETDSKVREIGSNTNRLISNRGPLAKYSGMSRQSSIAVTITKLAAN